MAPSLKRTPLYAAHRRAGAKMVEFAGWEMPVQYQGVIGEHLAVRSRAGLFDVSHMGEVEISGGDAVEFCQSIGANDVARVQVGQAQYNLLLNDQGGVVDDVIFYRMEQDLFLVCVNAANTEKDFRWIEEHARGRLEIVDVSARYAQLALQGPVAETILQPATAVSLADLKSFHFVRAEVAAVDCLVARTGYTGEPGFELYCAPEEAPKLWNALLEAGAPHGLVPAGLGARDTLRLEKAYPLYGHELDDTTTPLEAGLQWVTKFSKPSFIGRDALVKQREAGVTRKLMGVELIEPGIARADYAVIRNGEKIGRVTSGTKAPSLGKAIALAYMAAPECHIGNVVEIDIRGRNVKARIVDLPFYTGRTEQRRRATQGG